MGSLKSFKPTLSKDDDVSGFGCGPARRFLVYCHAVCAGLGHVSFAARIGLPYPSLLSPQADPTILIAPIGLSI